MDNAEHDVKEGSSQSPSNNNDSAPSAEDLDWADSCLTKLNEASDSDWSAFKESLLEILNVPTSDNDNNDHMDLGDTHTISRNQSVDASFSMMSDDHSDEDNDVDVSIGMLKKKWLKGKNSLEDALLPDHAEFAQVEESNDSKFWNLGSSEEQETSTGSIFKVWDLGVAQEQDEFTNALSSALGEAKSGADDGWQDSGEQMDHVIAGISGLSLGQSSN